MAITCGSIMLPSQKTDYSTQHAGKYYENWLVPDLKSKDYSDESYSKPHALNTLNISFKKVLGKGDAFWRRKYQESSQSRYYRVANP